MRPCLSLATLVLGLALTSGCAAADPPAFALRSGDWQGVRGTYRLDGGHELRVVGTRRHPRAEFDDGTPQPLEARSARDYLTRDGCTRLRFEPGINGTLVRVDVTHPRACAAR